MEEQEREYMIVMKVCGSLPPLSFIVYKSRGRTDTPVGVGTKERQLERHLSSSIITLLCSLHTTFFFSLFSVLATFFFLAFSSPLYLFFYPCRTVYLHFSLSLKQFPSHLFSPPLPPLPHLPSAWPTLFYRGVWIMSDTGDCSTSITSGCLTKQTVRHPGQSPPLQFAMPKLTHSHWLRKGR